MVKSAKPVLLILICLSMGISVTGQTRISLLLRLPDPVVRMNRDLNRMLASDGRLIADLTDLDAQIGRIIGVLENSGYPFAQVTMDSVTQGSTLLTGILQVDPGELVLIDTIMNRTGFGISQGVLSRLMNIRPGDPYRESAVAEASSRLNRLDYMKLARTLEVGFHPGSASLYLYPEKTGANRFDGWAGLSPDLKTAGRMSFSGALVFNLKNLIAQGENWQLDWHRSQDASQKLNLAAHIPYLAGLPVGAEAGFNLFRQDTGYLNISWNAGIPYHFSPGHLLSVFVRQVQSNVIEGSSGSLVPNRLPYTGFQSGIAWELVRLDNRVNPFRGIAARIEISTGKKNTPGALPVNQSEFSGSVSWYRPVAGSLAALLSLNTAWRQASWIYENEQYRLGGLNLLRGFDEDQFHADAFAVGSMEVRYLLDKDSHLMALADIGIIRSGRGTNVVVNYPAGIGVGGQLRTAGGIFRIIFALGKQGGEPVNFRNSKIHLGYIGVF
jgi:outer membrane protein assembly factor BamA